MSEVTELLGFIKETLINRLEKLEDKQDAMQAAQAADSKTLGIFINKIDYVKEVVDKLAVALGEISSKPAKRWDVIITVLITATVTGLISFILTQILK